MGNRFEELERWHKRVADDKEDGIRDSPYGGPSGLGDGDSAELSISPSETVNS